MVMTATDGRTAQRSVGNSTRPREKHGCDARHLQTAATAAADDDDVRQSRKELWEGEREREKRKGSGKKAPRGKREEERGTRREGRQTAMKKSAQTQMSPAL